jgi:hypothetical protein
VERDCLVRGPNFWQEVRCEMKEGRILLLRTRLCQSWHRLDSARRWFDSRKILLYITAMAFGGGHVSKDQDTRFEAMYIIGT